MEAGKRSAVETIAAEAERLLHLAQGSGNDVIAGLIQGVLDEARATLMGRGQVPTVRELPTSLVQFRPTKPSRLH